ncbi:MAG: DUF58 domain-containing protein [Magnetococcales bacterium]|nr:DUF58 domain-containing protein [Magnetococcales bacterium]
MNISSRLARPFKQARQPSIDSSDSPVDVLRKPLIALHREARGFSLTPTRIRSAQSGQYLSPFLGRGMTFAESRLYQPGDDVRHMDWQVTARTGKPYTKLFQEERERSVLVWVDFRRSMFFATRGRFKAVQAARMAAWISWVARFNHDRIGGLVFSEQSHREIRPRTGDKAVLRLIQMLCSQAKNRLLAEGSAPSDPHLALSQSLARLRRVVKPGSQLYLLSDFRNLDATGEAHLKQLARHNQIILLALHDPLEKSLPIPGLYPIRLEEGRLLLNSSDPKTRLHYEELFIQRQEQLQNLSRKLAGDFISISTQDHAVKTLQTLFVS